MTDQDTKTRILNAAERLLAEKGLAGMSLRGVTGEAGVNLAAVNYHFGSKEALAGAVLHRRIDPVNQARIAELDRLELRHGDEPVPVEAILHAFYDPMVSLVPEGLEARMFAIRVYGNLLSEPSDSWHRLFVVMFRETSQRFVLALHRALPHLHREELLWRFHFGVGAIIHVMSHADRLARISSPGPCPAFEPAVMIPAVIAYAAAGLRAPASDPPGEVQP